MINKGLRRRTQLYFLKHTLACTNVPTHTVPHFLPRSFDSFLCALCVRLDFSFRLWVSICFSVATLRDILYCTSYFMLFFFFLDYVIIFLWFYLPKKRGKKHLDGRRGLNWICGSDWARVGYNVLEFRCVIRLGHWTIASSKALILCLHLHVW